MRALKPRYAIYTFARSRHQRAPSVATQRHIGKYMMGVNCYGPVCKSCNGKAHTYTCKGTK